MNFLIPAVLVSACLFSQVPVHTAQSPAAVRGQVLDPSGASVPNASVTVIRANGFAAAEGSDEAGNYSFSDLAAGRYTVRVAAPGFAPFESAVDLETGRAITLDVRLSVALERQEITVAEVQPTQIELDPEKNAATLVVDGKQLDMLADEPDDLQADLLALAGPSVGPGGGQIFIDGFSTGQLPAKASIREVRANGNPFSAEYDRPGSGRVEVLTRPGAGRVRGIAGMNFADSALNARNPYALVKPPAQMRQYDLNLTGPIGTKASFTLDGGRQSQDSTVLINALVLDSSLQAQRVNRTVPAPNSRGSLSPRVDYAVTQNSTLTGRVMFNQIDLQNNNIGGFALPSRATSGAFSQYGAQLIETSVIGTSRLNETRFQYYHSGYTQRGDSGTPAIVVSGAFTGGGAALSLGYNNLDNYELTNMTSYTRGKHLVKYGARLRGMNVDSYSTQNFNGTYTFTSIGQYASTLRGLAAAYEYTVGGGTPLSSVHQADAAPFIQDDWRLKPNLTLSLGLRSEIQTNIRYALDWAPRVGVAWGVPSRRGHGRAPKTILRVGLGIFYDRVDMGLKLQTLRQNGVTQLFYVIVNPDFFPTAPSLGQLVALSQPQSLQLRDASIEAPRMLQSAATLERQLPGNVSVSVTYTNTRGVHQLRSRNINAPVSGVFPYGTADPLLVYESGALFKQGQVTVDVNARVNSKFTILEVLTYGHADSNSDGIGTYPANSYALGPEWGRAGFDVRWREQIGGTIALPWKIQLAPNINLSTSLPVNITTGSDLNGDTILSDRPAFATVAPGPPHPEIFTTPWGVFNQDPLGHPGSGTTIVPRNYGWGHGAVNVNGRISRTWSFGDGARRSLTASVQARNWINHTNPGAPIANLSSPFVGQSLSLQSGSSAAANRRLELSLRLSF